MSDHTSSHQKRWGRIPALAASAVFALGAVGVPGIAAAAPAFAEAPARSERAAEFEVDFLTGMIDHHHMAVMMAEECVDKAVHEELAAMCQDIIEVQSAEIEQMQTWLQDWYGITYEPQMSTGMMKSGERLSRLEGADYEIRFMQSMIRHHWSAIRESRTCLDRAEHEPLLELCEGIESTQLAEIEQMQTWLEEWYDRQGGRPASTA